jgi:hypothetical protein
MINNNIFLKFKIYDGVDCNRKIGGEIVLEVDCNLIFNVSINLLI